MAPEAQARARAAIWDIEQQVSPPKAFLAWCPQSRNTAGRRMCLPQPALELQ
jgi:hypothetical protein